MMNLLQTLFNFRITCPCPIYRGAIKHINTSHINNNIKTLEINMALSIGGKIISNGSLNNSETVILVEKYPLYFVVLLLTIFLTGIIGNILLIIAHLKDPLKLIKSSSSYFMLNISFVDLLLSCGLMFIIISFFVSFRVDMIVGLPFLLYTVSFTLYLSLAIQRLCSVAFPFWHRVNVTTRVCRYWVAGIWLLNIILAITKFTVMSRPENRLQSDVAMLVLMWLLFVMSQCLCIASCISIRKQNKELQSRQDMNPATERTIKIKLRNESNFIVTIAIVCFVLGVSILPFLTLSLEIIVNATASPRENYQNITPEYYIRSWLGNGINSSINVFVYIWRFSKYRKTFKTLFCDC